MIRLEMYKSKDFLPGNWLYKERYHKHHSDSFDYQHIQLVMKNFPVTSGRSDFGVPNFPNSYIVILMHEALFKGNWPQNSLFDPAELKVFSFLQPDVDLLSNCGDFFGENGLFAEWFTPLLKNILIYVNQDFVALLKSTIVREKLVKQLSNKNHIWKFGFWIKQNITKTYEKELLHECHIWAENVFQNHILQKSLFSEIGSGPTHSTKTSNFASWCFDEQEQSCR